VAVAATAHLTAVVRVDTLSHPVDLLRWRGHLLERPSNASAATLDEDIHLHPRPAADTAICFTRKRKHRWEGRKRRRDLKAREKRDIYAVVEISEEILDVLHIDRAFETVLLLGETVRDGLLLLSQSIPDQNCVAIAVRAAASSSTSSSSKQKVSRRSWRLQLTESCGGSHKVGSAISGPEAGASAQLLCGTHWQV
jgi:hypothetical protein